MTGGPLPRHTMAPADLPRSGLRAMGRLTKVFGIYQTVDQAIAVRK
jgi:hypothetical protein